MRLTYALFYVRHVEKAVAFYEKAFGIKRRFIHESGEYAEMETGTTTLAFSQHELGMQILKDGYARPDELKKPIAAQITFEPEDIKKAYETALAAGAKSVFAPEVKPWNWECAMVQDLDGHLVELAKPLD